MEIIRTVKQMQQKAAELRSRDQIIGLVPTMGYLHEGHLSLVAMAREKSDVVVLSIYVNPTQFAPHEDLEKYPRDFNRDEKLAKAAGVDILFCPSDEEMYPEPYLTYVNVDVITTILCGASRPDHFRGVTTICTKLFHAVQPHLAVFGQKDAQQAIVIQRMVQDLNFDLEIVIAAIVREPDGLAMSSRNSYLSENERRDAVKLYQSLQLARGMIESGEYNAEVVQAAIRDHICQSSHASIDYIACLDVGTMQSVEILHGNILIALAVFIGKTRLIDNIRIII